MYKIIILLAISIFWQNTIAQKTPIPIPVTKSFATQFPAGHLKKWQQSKAGYIATFQQNHKKYLATFSPQGEWKETESNVKWTRDLPKATRDAWNNCQYKDWLILDMKEIMEPLRVFYIIHVGQVQSLGPDDADIGSEYLLYFSEKGQLIKVERHY